jgi:2-polyprenyl-3-methyl-5-hydroxy-6-metoxy-1,4-benzoquinol methylase
LKIEGLAAIKQSTAMPSVELNRKEHWETVYSTRDARETSWNQVNPASSLAMIERSGTGAARPVIDVGGGASVLVDRLLAAGFSDLTVLDIAQAALEQAQRRLGQQASRIEWIEADITLFKPQRRYGLWHDRAVFHFLTASGDREAYKRCLGDALEPGGTLVLAAFAPTGPERCSGLDILRYDAERLQRELGQGFELQEKLDEGHITPGGRIQDFTFYRFLKMA